VRRQAPSQGFRTSLTSGNKALACGFGGALGGTRTPNLLIRSQMLYPLSYERRYCSILHSESMRVRARAAENAGICDQMRTAGTRPSQSGTTG
jgi:hypothetical protein